MNPLCCCANLVGSSNALILESIPSGQKVRLTAKDYQSLRLTWDNCKHKDRTGLRIFRRVFEKKPKLKDLFGLAAVSNEDLGECRKFRAHCTSFINFLDMTVKSLGVDPSYITPLTRTLGLRHVSFKEVRFDAENWLLFKTSIIECIVENSSPKDQENARKVWNRLLTFIIREMKDAFYKETHRRSSQPQVKVSVEDRRRAFKEQLRTVSRSLSQRRGSNSSQNSMMEQCEDDEYSRPGSSANCPMMPDSSVDFSLTKETDVEFDVPIVEEPKSITDDLVIGVDYSNHDNKVESCASISHRAVSFRDQKIQADSNTLRASRSVAL